MKWLLAIAFISSACGAVKDNGVCGDGKKTAGEECDEGSDNGAGSCCTETCDLVGLGTICRESVGDCDIADACNGVSGTCDDATMPDGSQCNGNGESACSAADTCQAGVCEDNNMPANSLCSGEPTCNPDRCDATGACVDTSALADNTTCTDNNGTLCCAGACSIASATCDACAAPDTGPLTIAIIESQSSPQGGQNQDDKWKAIADGLGHVATIQPQTFLDNLNNLVGVDVLIVSSHDIAVGQTRRDTITNFVALGKGVYIQGEFDPLTFEGNKVWEAVVDALGGNFTWGAQVSGALAINAAGCMAKTPVTVPVGSIGNAATGSSSIGARFGAIVTATPAGGAATPIGFRFCRQGGGLVMTTTDKDNIRQQATGVPEMMKNIIFRLGHPNICAP